MAKSQVHFAEVILPLALPKQYTYTIPFEWVEKVKIGQRVIVQFGKKKIYSAIVYKIHTQAPSDYKAKLIDEIADENPIVTSNQLKLWEWISNYYMCTLGEVMAAALPSALKLDSETIFLFNKGIKVDWNNLDDEAYLVAEALENNKELKLSDVQAILAKKSVQPIINVLMHHRICVVKEELQKKYSPKKMNYIALNERFKSENALRALFETLENKQKQSDALLTYLHLSPQRGFILKSELVKDEKVSSSSVNTLIKNEIFIEQAKTVSRLLEDKVKIDALEKLNEQQENALAEIEEAFQQKNVAVLEGVTGSGKTHVYIKLIEQAIEEEKQVLYLLPEIALTAQIVMRLKKYFGAKVGIYHSKFNDQERVEIYNSVLQKKYQIILSARSGIFLPFNNLGLIVVDEEHERSFKQFDPAPRYNARDMAVVMSHLYNAKTLMGSATLSLETLRNIGVGKFAHVKMTERFGNALLPEIEMCNTLTLRKQKRMQGVFSEPLKEAIQDALSQKEQVILFLNRRGFAQFANCNTCNWIPYCPHCDVSLTYHKFFNKLICHYCNYQERFPKDCKACGSKDLNTKGLGTEQVEDEITAIFPEAKVARLDLDTTRRKHGHEEIIYAFQNYEVDILIGTQMVTKGLDFDNVSLVGIVNADQMLNIPDFRAGEKAYQLIAQVSGRAGRKDTKGKVLIQTAQPNHPILEAIKNYEFGFIYQQEFSYRKQYKYPPYYNLINITLKHKQAEAVTDAAFKLTQLLRKNLSTTVLGPSTPPVSRIKNMYLRQIMIKMPKDQKIITATKQQLSKSIDDIQRQFKTVRIILDVDP